MANEYNTIGSQVLTVGAAVIKPTIPIGTKLGFIETEGDVRYSVNNQDSNLTASTGGALLSDGTKIDFKGYDLFALRLISADATDKTVHLTYLG